VHVAAPEVEENVPAGQDWHDVAASLALNCPGLQGAQETEGDEAFETWGIPTVPFGHGMQLVNPASSA